MHKKEKGLKARKESNAKLNKTLLNLKCLCAAISSGFMMTTISFNTIPYLFQKCTFAQSVEKSVHDDMSSAAALSHSLVLV